MRRITAAIGPAGIGRFAAAIEGLADERPRIDRGEKRRCAAHEKRNENKEKTLTHWDYLP